MLHLEAVRHVIGELMSEWNWKTPNSLSQGVHVVQGAPQIDKNVRMSGFGTEDDSVKVPTIKTETGSNVPRYLRAENI